MRPGNFDNSPTVVTGVVNGATKKTIYPLSWHRLLYSLFQNDVLGGLQNYPQITACLSLEVFFPHGCKDWIS